MSETSLRFGQLRPLLERFVRRLLVALPEPGEELVQTIEFEDAGGASFPQELRPDFLPLIIRIHRLSEEIASWEEFETLVVHIRADPVLASDFLTDAEGKPVSEGAWLVRTLVEPYVRNYLELKGDTSWDQAAFNQVFNFLSSYVESPTVPFEAVSPISGFASEVDVIELEQQVRLRRLSPSEKRTLFESVTGFPFGLPFVEVTSFVEWTHAAEAHFPQEKRAGMATTPAQSIGDLVTALRLYKPSRITTAFTQVRPTSPTFGLLKGYATLPGTRSLLPHAVEYRLTPQEVDGVRELFTSFRRRPRDVAYELALRRFSSAYERPSDEDRLIDYWVALEALFLPDATQELSYRVALRVARYVGETPGERKQLFRETRDSYTARSKVLHGRVVPALREITGRTEDVLRRALRFWLDPGKPHDVVSLDSALLD